MNGVVARRAVIALTIAFAARGLLLVLSLPYGDPIDEIFHFAYAEFVASAGRIPRAAEDSVPLSGIRLMQQVPRATHFGGPKLTFEEFMKLSRHEQRVVLHAVFAPRDVERGRFAGSNYETQQPPLVYELAAAALRVSSERVDVRLFVVRLIAIVFATAAVPLSYAFFRRLFAKRAAVAATLAFVTFPGPGLFTARFTNDALALPLAVALVVFMADITRGRLTKRATAGLAATLAAALWTKLYFLAFLPAIPVAALFAQSGRRLETVRRALIASAIALLVIVPWFVRQHADSGDWLGLQETRAARAAGLDLMSRLHFVPAAFAPVMLEHFWRGFVSPGTWSAMAATDAASVLVAIGLGFAIAVPQFRRRVRSPRRARTWWAPAVALLFFLATQVAHFATFAALHIPAGGEGWYLLILLPLVIAGAAAFGTRVPAWCFVVAAAFFVAADIAGIRFLASIYAGGTHLSAIDVFSRVGLLDVSPEALAAITVVWLAGLLFAGAKMTARA